MLVLVLLGAALAGCTKGQDYDGCVVERPAFLVNITASAGPLPEDTRLHVSYGAGEEDYVLTAPAAKPDVVFCTALGPEAGVSDAGSGGDAASDGGSSEVRTFPVQALLCELWTQGAATITLEGGGYPSVVRTLKASRDHCGIETVDVALSLNAPDAGG